MGGLGDKFRVTTCVEQIPYRQQVLKKHLPHAKIYADIKSFTPRQKYPIVCGGSPCQGNSAANPKGAGLLGEQSGLWFEMLRVIGKAQPFIVLWENPSGSCFLKRKDPISPLGVVLWSLTSLGYYCEWQSVKLSHLGGNTRRERILLIAYSNGWQAEGQSLPPSWAGSIGDDAKELYASWSCESPTLSGVAPRIPSQLHQGVSGWWKSNPFNGVLSMGRTGIKHRYERNSAYGDSCSPLQSAIAWKQIYRLLQWAENNIHQENPEA